MSITLDQVDKVMAFESGTLSSEDTIVFFQEIINDGSVWSLQGYYGRFASGLINEGCCHE